MVRTLAFAMTTLLRMTTTMATILGLPLWTRRSNKARMAESWFRAARAAMKRARLRLARPPQTVLRPRVVRCRADEGRSRRGLRRAPRGWRFRCSRLRAGRRASGRAWGRRKGAGESDWSRPRAWRRVSRGASARRRTGVGFRAPRDSEPGPRRARRRNGRGRARRCGRVRSRTHNRERASEPRSSWPWLRPLFASALTRTEDSQRRRTVRVCWNGSNCLASPFGST
jgi:hypothetical protein